VRHAWGSASAGGTIVKDLAYAAAMETRRPKCPTCGEWASVGGAIGTRKDGVDTVMGYAFTCPNNHHWNDGCGAKGAVS